MIQLSAPSISANVASPGAAAPSGAPQGAETASFAALLGAAGSLAGTAEPGAQDTTAAITASLAGLPDGKTGKAGGKTLPVTAELAGPDLAAANDPETDEAPDEAASDQADVPIAAAIPVLSLIVPPLPGTDNPVEFRAAGPVSTTGHGATPLQSRPETASQVARIATAAPVAQQAATQGLAPAQVLQVKLAPVVTADAQPETDSETGTAIPASTVARIATTEPPAPQTTARSATPAQAPQGNVAPVVTVDAQPEADGTTGTPGPASTVARIATTEPPAPQTTARSTTPAQAPQGNVAPVVTVDAQPETDGETGAAIPASTVARNVTARAADAAPAAAAPASSTPAGTEAAPAEPQSQGTTQPASHLANAQILTASRPSDVAPGAIAAPATPERPHDFATLVDRLAEAREAASPQVVRTALQHAEFGRVSLQFRHDDASLSVTMANSDPAFASAVQGAVAASLAGNAAGSGDQPRGDGQQASAQQQSAASGNGQSQGQGQQQAAQARAEQGERTNHRGQAASAGSQQGGTGSSDRAQAGTRRSGIYA